MAALLGLGLGAAGGASAHDYAAGDLVIAHPYATATAPTAKTAAGYLTITNKGSAPDTLVAVKADFPEVSLHTVETDAQGVTRMLPAAGIEIAPGATVELAPRTAHVMFIGLPAPFEAGEEVAATLVFEKAGEVAVDFTVEPRAGAGAAHGDAQGDHDMGDMPGMKPGMEMDAPGSGG
jgi:copper(I)-binding protein